MAILREYLAEQGFSLKFPEAVEDLPYVLTPQQAEEVGLMELAFELIRAGADPRAIGYCAGDQNGIVIGSTLEQINRLARGFAEQCPDRELVKLLLMLRLRRAFIRSSVAAASTKLAELASKSTTRFGPGILVEALRSTMPFYERGDANTRERVLLVFPSSWADAELDALIDDILVRDAD